MKLEPGDLDLCVGEGARYYPWRSNSFHFFSYATSEAPPPELHPELDGWLCAHISIIPTI